MSLKGNHEDMFLMMMGFYENDMHCFIEHLPWYYKNGGQLTLMEFNKESKESQEKLIDFIKGLPAFKIVDDFILVHAGVLPPIAGVSYDISTFMSLQKEDDLLWIIDSFINSKISDKYTVVFGHNITHNLNKDKSNRIYFDEKHKDKIGIDCGSFLYRTLGCLRLEDMKEIYIKD